MRETILENCFLLAAGAWLALQVLAFWRLSGAWRKASFLSAIVMGLALCLAIFGVLAGSNLAPIWVVFALPVCFAWIVILWIARGLTWAIAR
jgi:hypothetical protein